MALQDEIDGLIRTREVCELVSYGPRWLSEKIKRGEFPPPDVPAPRKGAPDKWRRSTIRSVLDQMQARGRNAA
jgi:predicted DNA-binding transcriptional regulator AlpA